MSNLVDRVGKVTDFGNGPSEKIGGKSKNFSAEFGKRLKKALEEIDNLQENADKLSRELAVGHDVPLHETMIALEKADISLRLFVQVRNKIVEAYREVMHMQF